jgi:cytochrome c peroxidase/serine/threonine protein kinase
VGPDETPAIPGQGQVVAGRYRIERVLGKGGMGLVVAAEHLSLRRRVAVKFLLPEALSRAEAVERFVREARAAAAIQNDHVARILDVGIQESGAPYIVMEYLTGCDLGHLLRERGTLPAEEAVGYVLEACEALAEAHARGIVHRDLKPSNLFLASPMGGPPVVKILDFGLAKALPTAADNEESITTTDLVMGSLHYMSPEQMRSLKQADDRSDIWSLGVILYELVSGRRPFQGDSLPASLLMIGLDPPSPIPAGAAPPGLEAVILRCLEKDRNRRPQSVAELALLLGPFGPPGAQASVDRIVQCRPPSDTAPVPVEPEPSAAPSEPIWDVPSETHTAPTSVPARTRLGSRPFLWIVAGAVLVAAALASRTCVGQRSPSEIEADRLASFSPLPVDAVPADPVLRRRIELGGRLFAEPGLSRNGDIACTSCHPLDRYGVDGKKLSRGSDDREPPRNTLSVYNTAGFFTLLWDGRKDDLVEQAKEVLLSPRAMAASADELPGRVGGLPGYDREFAAAFPDDAAPISFDNIARALAAFEATLYSRGRWDRFLEGDRAALSDEEKAGFNRFVEVGCVTCHFGPNVGATMFQRLGLVKAWPDSRDRGRFEITRRDVDWMVFRVPTLRNVEATGPYFHDGSVSDLDTAIQLMARHQLGKELDPRDVRLIRSWLASLTGDPPDARGSPRRAAE